jgi:hypothetical protein
MDGSIDLLGGMDEDGGATNENCVGRFVVVGRRDGGGGDAPIGELTGDTTITDKGSTVRYKSRGLCCSTGGDCCCCCCCCC